MSDLPPPSSGSTPPPPPPPDLTPPPGPGAPVPPPGYTAYGTGPTPLAQLRRVKGVSTATMILVGITALGTLIATAVAPTAADRATEFLDGQISEDEFLDAYGPSLLAQALQGVGQIAAAVLTMIWLYRVAANVRAFGRATTFAPLFAIFGWILPPILVVIPFLMVREVWKASDPDVAHDATSWKSSRENPLVWAWFVVYGIVPVVLLVLSFDTLASAGLGGDTEDLAKSLDEFGALNLISAATTVVAAILWILVVKQVTARHMRLTNER